MQYSLWNLWASRRGRCNIPCGTCWAQGVLGAVFLVELVGLKAKILSAAGPVKDHKLYNLELPKFGPRQAQFKDHKPYNLELQKF